MESANGEQPHCNTNKLNLVLYNNRLALMCKAMAHFCWNMNILLLTAESPFAKETPFWKENDPLFEGCFVDSVNMTF